ncbi:P450-derived glycosyltransferase activator [Streptomyces coeruleorubidus]|uniref:P450-derived glycosyltransferase activator n=1 Tax=Streptomyces coeruleorubidus TaxID=116188 RepID=UPI0037A3FCB1
MIITESDDRLREHLMLTRGYQWVQGAQGDPFALLLRSDNQDPDALRVRVREQGPVFHSITGTWVTGDHALGSRILADPGCGPRHPGVEGPQEHLITYATSTQRFCHVLALEDAFLNLDRAACERLAMTAEAAMGPEALEPYTKDARGFCEQRLEDLRGAVDLMSDYAAPTAAALVGKLLGLGQDDRDRFTALARGLAPVLDSTVCPPSATSARHMSAALSATRELLSARLEERRQERQNDLLSAFTRTASEEDALALAMVTSVAGVEVLANLVANTMAALLERPEQWELVRRDPGMAGQAVEETLRHDPPVRLHSLITQHEVELAGETVPADSHVVVVVDAANRDPGVCSDPDTFDLTRTAAPHLTLPVSLPVGLAGRVARFGATAAVGALAVRRPTVTATEPPTRHLRSPVVGRVARQPVSL